MSDPIGSGYSIVSYFSRPWNKTLTWDGTPLGLKTAAPCQPRAALAAEGSEKRWSLQFGGSGAAPGG
jgi:hypothetical protein